MLPLRMIVLVALNLLALSAQADAPVYATAPVKVSGGEIAGTRAGAMAVYLGVPFAAAPVGPLRWRAPQAVVPWKGIRQANSFSAACAQTAVWVTHPKSEDCLYLNVWAPEQAGKLPVIVWLHGGGYYGGTAAQDGYNGSRLASHGAVVVTLNYRLGIFGFFAHPELSAESPAKSSGNQGVEDQIAALRWVRHNIGAFGGDPRRVTIVGESAGAGSVAVLLASPLAKGLFQRAIAESGTDALPTSAGELREFDRKAAQADGLAFAKGLGAPHLAELRALSVEALHKPAWRPRTIVEGHVLPEVLSTQYPRRRHNDVPLLLGWNAEEGKDLAPEILGTGEFTAAGYGALVNQLLGYAPSPALLAMYPATTDAQAAASMNQLTTDWWGWRMAQWAGLQARHGRSKAYVYLFAHRPPAPVSECTYGCGIGHGMEIQYVFDQLDLDKRPWTVEDRQLATRMAATWVNFAGSGSPNGTGLPAWPAYDGTPASIMRIGNEADERSKRLPDFSLFAQPLR